MEVINKGKAIEEAIRGCADLNSKGRNSYVKFVTAAGIVKAFRNVVLNDYESSIAQFFYGSTRNDELISDCYVVNKPYYDALKLDNATVVFPNGKEEIINPMIIFVDSIIGISIEKDE